MVPQTFDEYNRYLDETQVEAAIKRGHIIADYQETLGKRQAKKAVRKKFMGYQILVLNTMTSMSEMGNELARSNCDFALMWFYNHSDKSIEVSLRTIHDRFDMVRIAHCTAHSCTPLPDHFLQANIATRFGGGGHQKAAGFRWGRSIESLLGIADPQFRLPPRDQPTAKDERSDAH